MRSISAAYLERKLRAILGLSGSNAIPELEDVSGFLTLEADRPEWAFPGGEILLAFGENAVAGVGEFSYITIENPAASGMLVIVERIKSQPNDTVGQSNPFALFTERAPLVEPPIGQSTAIRGFTRDLRWGIQSGVAIVRTGNDAVPLTGAGPSAAHGILFAGAATVATGDEHTEPWILPPATRLWLIGGIVNNQIAAWFSWRERPLEGLVEIR